MEIKVFNNVFENKFETFEYNTTKPLLEQIEEHIKKETYRQTMVECYDSETGETFYAPMIEDEIETPSVVILANGVSVDKNYEPEDDELVNVIFLPTSERAGKIIGGVFVGAVIGAVFGSLIIGAGLLIAAGAGMFASAATASILGTAGWVIGGLAVAGAIAGGFIANNRYEKNQQQKLSSTRDSGKQGSQLPDVRGAENSSIRGNNFPFVIGKHLITPFVIGDPYTEYSGPNGSNAYIHILLCAGYAPLKLTDFKLGEFWLAYNRTHKVRTPYGQSVDWNVNTLLSGTLAGYSYAGYSDNGDILDYWKNNNIKIEIIQQPLRENQEVGIDDIYQEHTTIDLANRPQISASTMQGAGWTGTIESPCTVHAQKYSTEDLKTTVLVTPILSDGTVLTPEQTENYANQLLNGETIDVDILLNTFYGTDSVEQSVEYALGLEDNQLAYYNQRPVPRGTWYGKIYPYAINDQAINANVFYIADKQLDTTAQVTYKGVSFPNTFRTNGVWFTDSCPMEFTVNIDFPSGLYRTYTLTETSGNSSTTTVQYATIPMWVCAQWRIYNNTNASSDPTGKDYADWNNLVFYTPDGEHTYTGNFNYNEAQFDRQRHKGNSLPGSPVEVIQSELDKIYGSFIGKNLQNFTPIGGQGGISEIRLSAKVTLTDQQIAELMADTNPGHLVEVRVLRVSPNYINQVSDSDSSESSTNVGMENYSDLLKVTSIVTKSFNEETYIKTGEIVPVRPLSEKDYSKYCLIAIEAKADASGYLGNQLSQINCMAESFSPVVKKTNDAYSVLPEGIHEVKKYYGYFDQNNNPVNRSNANGVTEREVTRAEYEQARQAGYNWYRQDCGTNFSSVMNLLVFGNSSWHNGFWAFYQQSDSKIYNNSSVASGFLLACVGPQNGPVALGYESLDLNSIIDWYRETIYLRDGTTANRAFRYNGRSYRKGDEILIRMEANGYVYAGIKLEDLLQKIAFCGRAIWAADDNGRIRVIMDRPADYTAGVINAQNCISNSNTFNYEELVAGYQVSFSDENDGYETNQFYVWGDGNDLQSYHGQISPLSIDFVTNNYQMWSLGRYVLAVTLQSKEVLTRKIGPEGKLFHLGDVVLVQSEDLLIGDCSGRVQEVLEENGVIYGFICDAPYDYKAEQSSDDEYSTQGVTILQPRYYGKSNTVTLPIDMPGEQTVDGKVYTLAKGTTNIVLFGTPVAKGNDDPSVTSTVKYNIKTGDICMFGLRDKISAPYRITKIKPEKDGCFTETLIPYDESVYRAGKELPSFQNYITPPEVVEPPISLIEGPSSVSDQQNSLNSVNTRIDNITNGDADVANPADPVWIIAKAEQNRIHLVWEPIQDDGLANTIKKYIIQYTKDSGTTWNSYAETSDSEYDYAFNRDSSADGYPETSDFSTWSFRIKAENIYGKQSGWVQVESIDVVSYGTWIPATPIVTEANADRDGISIKFTVSNTNRYGDKKYEVFVNHGGTSYPVAIQGNFTARYTFNRSNAVDGYPEAFDFNNWTVTVKNSNEAYPSGQTSAAYTVTANGYGTWQIPQVTITKEVLDRSVILTAVYAQSNVEVYGNIQTLVKIKRKGNSNIDSDSGQAYNTMLTIQPDSDYCTPEFSKSVSRTESADILAFNGDTEWNYKAYNGNVAKTDYYVSNTNKITHTLPLIGQNPRMFLLGNVPITKIQQVYPIGTENPHSLGWYELDQGSYVATSDTTVNDQKTYYADYPVFAWDSSITTENTVPQSPSVGDIIKWVAANRETAPLFETNCYYYYSSSGWQQAFAKSLAVETEFEYKIGMTNEAYPLDINGEKTGVFASPITAVAMPTNISDIVHAHEHYKEMYVEKLSAISANIGVISQGGMGDFSNQLNYWALSTLQPQETGLSRSVEKGEFRVGGVNEYFKVTPIGNDEYKIELKAGNIELTSTAGGGQGMDFLKGTYIYSEDKKMRMTLSPKGIVIQKNTDTQHNPPNWNDASNIENLGQVTIDEKQNFILSNSDSRLPFGQTVSGNVYHFESNATNDESGSNTQNIGVDGQIISTSTLSPILDPVDGSSKCFSGTVSKTISSWEGRVAYLSKASVVRFGSKGFNLQGEYIDVPDPLTGYSSAMREDSTVSGYTGTVGSYLGLNNSQVEQGIFY